MNILYNWLYFDFNIVFDVLSLFSFLILLKVIHILPLLTPLLFCCLIFLEVILMSKINKDFYELYCEEVIKNEELTKELKRLKRINLSLTQEINYLRKNQEKIIETKVNAAVEKVTQQFEDKVVTLEKQVSHLKSILNNDSSNSGIPTSQTPINKNKRIPNSREKSNRPKGGQKGHVKHSLELFDEKDITDYRDHRIDECPICHSPMNDTTTIRYKDEWDFKVIVKKIRHRFIETQCPICGHKENVKIPSSLKEANQYGTGVQALALTLMNEGYISINRTKSIISGLTHGEINLSEGYISKLQSRLYKNLEEFDGALRREIIALPIVHWDDTVIMISTNRACLRFYGNDSIAYYTAHMHKDKAGLDEDGILSALDSQTVVVHDHNIINYNDDYEFQNAECCVHLLRDLKKVVDNLQHQWPRDMINLLLEGNVKRNNGEYVDVEYLSLAYDRYLATGELENFEDEKAYYADTEMTLIKRMREYKENYLMWTMNEEIPFSNNESERSLRGLKTKMKVSGQFNNLKSAQYYARIKSYIETGHRFGMGSIYLIEKALEGKPLTIEEMKKHDDLD